jgi:hypothetical protein
MANAKTVRSLPHRLQRKILPPLPVIRQHDNLDEAPVEAADSSFDAAPEERQGFHKQLKTKFIEGSAGFMSLVASGTGHRSGFLHRTYHLSQSIGNQCKKTDEGRFRGQGE